VVADPAEIVGVVGGVFTVTTVAVDTVEVQPFAMVRTEYEPPALTLIDWVVSLVDQR
jgi:hypothetical protein